MANQQNEVYTKTFSEALVQAIHDSSFLVDDLRAVHRQAEGAAEIVAIDLLTKICQLRTKIKRLAEAVGVEL